RGRLPLPGVPARRRGRRAGHAQDGRAGPGAAARGARAGAVREVPVLLGRVRPARAVLPARVAVPVGALRLPAYGYGGGSLHRTDRGAAGPDALRRQRKARIPARRPDVSPPPHRLGRVSEAARLVQEGVRGLARVEPADAGVAAEPGFLAAGEPPGGLDRL